MVPQSLQKERAHNSHSKRFCSLSKNSLRALVRYEIAVHVKGYATYPQPPHEVHVSDTVSVKVLKGFLSFIVLDTEAIGSRWPRQQAYSVAAGRIANPAKVRERESAERERECRAREREV